MNVFLDDVFTGKELKSLDQWSQKFWKIRKDLLKIKLQFAEQGYEDKGHGHIRRIISNAGELLEKYFEVLYESNEKMENGIFLRRMKKKFEKNLILLYVAAHLHDIGIGFPGIFKPLSEYLERKDQVPGHIGEIIHEYHHYGSFIMLMEMSCFELTDYKIEESEYLSNIVVSTKGGKNSKKAIYALNDVLKAIYMLHFDKFFENFSGFKVILGILCLLHKEINNDYVQYILSKFKKKNVNQVKIFNRWWSYFQGAKSWTDKVYQRFSRNDSNELPECDDAELLGSKDEHIIDLSLVEALLQYGDKTEITIARLARKPVGTECLEMPLKMFIEDTRYDGQIGYINTKMAQKVISDYARARACCFIPVPLITVEKSGNDSQGKEYPGLDIVLHYSRFDGDDDIFKRIRYQNEKDFYDLDFLRVICFHIPMVIHNCQDPPKENRIFKLKFKKKEHQINDKDDLEKLSEKFPESLGGLNLIREEMAKNPRKNFPYTRQNKEAINRYAKLLIRTEKKKKVFYESCDLDVPGSFEIMAILSLFTREV